MGTRIPQVDAYIAAAAPFARPILKKLRTLFHQGCPEINEAIKWGVPHFEYHGLLGSMAAFKQHVSFGFWRGARLSLPEELFCTIGTRTEMSALRVETLADLPADDLLLAMIGEAATLNAEIAAGEKPTGMRKKKRAKRPPLRVPPDFLAALEEHPLALATFLKMPPSHRREYVEWINEAKRPETRQRRMTQAIAMLSEGKPRNWKYMEGCGERSSCS